MIDESTHLQLIEALKAHRGVIEAHLEGGLLSILAAFVYVMAILEERSGE